MTSSGWPAPPAASTDPPNERSVATPPSSLEDRLAELERLAWRAATIRFSEQPQATAAAVPRPSRSERRRKVIDAGVMIAALAFLFSVVGYWLDGRSATVAERRDFRSQLSELVRQVNDIPIEEATLALDLGAEKATALGGVTAARQAVLLGQIHDILDRRPSIAIALDHFVVGEAYTRNGQWIEARAAYEQALRLAKDPTIDLAARRGLATMLFLLGDLDGARAEYDRALHLADRYGDVRPEFLEYSDLITRLGWASGEQWAGRCVEAAAQLEALNQAATSTRTPSFYMRPIGYRVAQVIGAIRVSCPGQTLEVSRLAELAGTGAPTAPVLGDTATGSP